MKRILLVDDDQQFLQALAREILSRGYRVDEATDGLEAIDKALREPPDIAVVDLIMPRVGGSEVVSFFRQNPYLARTPIIILSGVLVESAGAVDTIDADLVLNKGPFAATSRLLLDALDRLSAGPRSAKQVITQPDIHERRQVVELLRVKRDLGSILERAAAGIVELDVSGRVAYANARAEELLGIARGSLIGNDMLSLFPRSSLAGFQTLLGRFEGDAGPTSRAMTSTMEQRTIRTVLSSIWAEGQRRSTVMTLLEVAPEAEAHDRPVRLLQYLAHEMRSALLMVQGKLRAMERHPAQGDNATESADDAATVSFLVEEAGRLVRMLDDATSFHRTLRELPDIEKESIDLVSLVRDSISGVMALAEPQGIDVTFRGAAVAPRVWGHHDKLLQVLYNLLLNAVRFTPRGGRVWVELAVSDDAIATTVADTGRGMARDELREVMAQAEQAELFLPRKGKRVGLGLAIAHQIVRAHRGQLHAESTPGAGSRFTFTLPLAPDVRAAAPPSVAQGAGGR